MTRRIITGTVSMLILLIVAACYETVVFPAAVAFFAGACVYEAYMALGVSGNMYVALSVLLTAACVILAEYAPFLLPLMAVLLLLSAILCAVMSYETVPVDVMLCALGFQIVATAAFSGVTFMLGRWPLEAPFYLSMIAVCAWVSDMGAYFAGTFFGKHKMAPQISPKKTVEGLFGGILAACIGMVLLTFVYRYLVGLKGFTVSYDYPRMLLCAVAATLAGVTGDLFASVIKRAHGLKDFGNLFPGHGGALDRFDSVIVCALTVLAVALYLPLLRLQ